MSALFTAISIDVIDPLNRTGKITIPSHYVVETKGLLEFWSGTSTTKDLSLCLLFQKGRCNAGARCHQVHAAPSFVAKLRSQADAGRACCALHGDFQSSGFLSDTRTVTVAGPTTAVYALSSFGRTAALDAALRAGSATKVLAAKICRLHAKGACKFGKDCKNIHLCPEASPVSAKPSVGIQNRAAEHMEKSALLEQSSLCGLSTTSFNSSPSTHRNARTPDTTPEDSPKERPLSYMATPPPVISPPVVAPLSFLAEDSIWKMPESMTAPSPSSWLAGFEHSLSLVAADLSMPANRSPSFGKW